MPSRGALSRARAVAANDPIAPMGPRLATWRHAQGNSPSMGPRLASRGSPAFAAADDVTAFLQWDRGSRAAEAAATTRDSPPPASFNGTAAREPRKRRRKRGEHTMKWFPSMGPRLASRGSGGFEARAGGERGPSMGPRLASRGSQRTGAIFKSRFGLQWDRGSRAAEALATASQVSPWLAFNGTAAREPRKLQAMVAHRIPRVAFNGTAAREPRKRQIRIVNWSSTCPSMGPRLASRGSPIGTPNGLKALLPSMGPRLASRGSEESAASNTEEDGPSMGPRLASRGSGI